MKTSTATGITKINKINNAGIFTSYAWPSTPQNLSFEKINLIYGYNGSGKTTLSNIIGLFSEEHDDLEVRRIEKRLTADPSKPLKIEIEWDGEIAKHPTAKKKLYVFNSDFVASHVYDGTQTKVLNFKQVVTKEQLLNPALKKIEEAIIAETTQANNVNGYLNDLEKLFIGLKSTLSTMWNKNIEGKRMPSISFEKCPQEPSQKSEKELLKELEEEFSKFKVSKNQGALDQAVLDLTQITHNPISLSNTMIGTIEKSITKTAREKVQRKIDVLKVHAFKHSSIQNWFEDGASLLRNTKDDKTCPLCDSALPNIDELIASYDAFFNDELTNFMHDISGIITMLDDLQIESQNKMSQCLRVQILMAEYNYQDMVTKVENVSLVRLKDRGLTDLINTVKVLFEKKKEAIDFTPSAEELERIRCLTDDCNQFFDDILALISVKDKILSRLQSALFIDKNAKTVCELLLWKQFDNQGKKLAEEAKSKQENDKNELSISNTTGGCSFFHVLKKALQFIQTGLITKEAEKVVELSKLKKESEYVNEFLARLCVNNFKISTQGDEGITIHYSSVPPKDEIHSLSEGEKTALAFAYFLSKYRHEVLDNPQVENEDFTIVIDDPVSSLDENRLFSTALVIQDLLVPRVLDKQKNGNGQWAITKWDGCQQIIILSHNVIFLKFMSNLIDQDQCRGRADLHIENGKILTLPNSLRNYQTSYFQKLEKIQDYVDGEIEHEYAKDFLPNYIRVTLEAFISFKFARLREKGNKNLPAMMNSLITMATNETEATMFDSFIDVSGISNAQTLKTVLLEIKHKTNPECHGTTQDITHLEYLSEPELRKLAEQALNVIQFLDQIHYKNAQSLKQRA